MGKKLYGRTVLIMTHFNFSSSKGLKLERVEWAKSGKEIALFRTITISLDSFSKLCHYESLPLKNRVSEKL